MCWMCGNPEMTVEDSLERMAELVRKYGWATQLVEGGTFHSPWAYTIGLTAFGLPELLVTGLPQGQVDTYLNGYGAHLMHAEPPLPGETFELIGTPMLEVVEVAEPTAHMPTAIALFGPAIRALQLVRSDDRGKWPWDVGFRSSRWPQPVLGPRAPERSSPKPGSPRTSAGSA